MPRLFVPADRLEAELLAIDDEDFRYLARVLRLIVGDEVTLFDGTGVEADARVTRIGPRALELTITARRSVNVAARPVTTLIVGLMKGDKMEYVIQKATELGVNHLVPVRTVRSIVRLDRDRALTRGERWDKIAREASRQCGRADVPDIAPVVDLDEALAVARPTALKLFFWEEKRGRGLAEVLPAKAPKEVVCVVGPEGGFAAEEAKKAFEEEFELVGLGPRILRAETAAVAALAVIGFALGDLR